MQSEMEAANGHPPAAGAGSTGVLWSERCCALAWSLPVPCLSLLPGQVPPSLAEGRGGLFSQIPTLTVVRYYQRSCELSRDGQPGSPAVVHPSCRGRGRGSLSPLLCLWKDPRAPSHPQPLGTNAPRISPVAQCTSLSHPCSERSVLCPGPPASSRDATLWLALERRLCCSGLFLWSQGLFPFIFSL